MNFWIRHGLVLVLSILVPFGGALYLDTSSTVEQAKEASRRSLQLAVPSLQLILQNEAYRSVSAAISYAQRITDDSRYATALKSGSKGDAATQEILKFLNEAVPEAGRGFAWWVDDKGRVLLANGQTDIDEGPRSIAGHPIFIETQRGYALDGIWSSHRELVQVAAAPLVDGGEIRGAVFIGRPIDKKAISEWAETLHGHITLASDEGVMLSSASDALAKTVVEAAYDAVSPEYAGQSEASLADATFSFLPLLVDHRAEGEAFISFGTPVLGAPPRLQWIISVDATKGLADVAKRQSVILGAMVAALLIALLTGILNYRSYVVPPDRIAEHLSELQMGRGDSEMPEASVSAPFRRLVRLINMTVQKLPNRGLALPTADLSSITRPPGIGIEELPVASERPATGSASLFTSGLLSPAGGPNAHAAPEPTSPPPARPPSVMLSSIPSAADVGSPMPGREPSEILMAPEPLDSVMLEESPAPEFPTPPPHLANGGASFESSEETEAMLPPGHDPASFDLASVAVPPTPGAEAAIAEAIAQLEGAQAAAHSGGSPASSGIRRSAADIRGRPMGNNTPSGPFEEVSIPPSAPVAPSVRGGGSLDLRQSAALPDDDAASFGPEATVVAPVATELLAQSARDDLTGRHPISPDEKPDATVVANVPADLLAKSAQDSNHPIGQSVSLQAPPDLDPEDREHFIDVYERFIELRRKCGESSNDVKLDRFVEKLARNRDNLVKKYKCRTVRFQVYIKDGKAALKATPVGGSRS